MEPYGVLAVIAFILACIVQIQSKGASLLAWAVIALSVIPGLAFLRSL